LKLEAPQFVETSLVAATYQGFIPADLNLQQGLPKNLTSNSIVSKASSRFWQSCNIFRRPWLM